MTENAEYILGHTDPELDRLQLQAKVIEGTSRRLIRECGIKAGMRVLDVGCGVGDMSMLLAEAVGTVGHVVAFDREPRPIEMARARAQEAGFSQIEFAIARDDALADSPPFDAVVGRYILMHQSDPSAMVRRVAAAARHGGIVAFHELAMRIKPLSSPEVALFDRTAESIEIAFGALVQHYDIGERLVACFAEAGLPNPQVIWECVAGTSVSPILPWLASTYQMLLPYIERLGIFNSAIGNPATLAERLIADTAAVNAQLVSKPQACAWAIKP